MIDLRAATIDTLQRPPANPADAIDAWDDWKTTDVNRNTKTAKASPPAEPVPREPTVGERRGIEAAKAFCRDRPDPMAFKVDGADGNIVKVSIPHNDRGGFEVQRRATFGTTSYDFATLMTTQVGLLVRAPGHEMPSEAELNTGVAAVAGIAPKNEMEAMLAVQMVGVNEVALQMLNRAKRAQTSEAMERYGTLATKMLRTFTAQTEAMAKLRRGGEQTVRVEHVHVYSGGQAIVGQVTTAGGRAGATLENGGQPHARIGHALSASAAFAVSAGGTVLCEDASRNGVPVTGGEGQAAVPNARGRKGKRCAQG